MTTPKNPHLLPPWHKSYVPQPPPLPPTLRDVPTYRFPGLPAWARVRDGLTQEVLTPDAEGRYTAVNTVGVAPAVDYERTGEHAPKPGEQFRPVKKFDAVAAYAQLVPDPSPWCGVPVESKTVPGTVSFDARDYPNQTDAHGSLQKYADGVWRQFGGPPPRPGEKIETLDDRRLAWLRSQENMDFIRVRQRAGMPDNVIAPLIYDVIRNCHLTLEDAREVYPEFFMRQVLPPVVAAADLLWKRMEAGDTKAIQFYLETQGRWSKKLEVPLNPDGTPLGAANLLKGLDLESLEDKELDMLSKILKKIAKT